MASVDPVTSSQSQLYISSQQNAAAQLAASNAYQAAEQAQVFALEDANALADQDQANLNGTNNDANANTSSIGSDLLNLSPEALNILNGVSGTNDNTTFTDTTITFSAGTDAGATALTTQQQTALNAILAQVAGRPLTPQTFAQVQGELTAAGISPTQVSLNEIILALNLNNAQFPSAEFAANVNAVNNDNTAYYSDLLLGDELLAA